MCAGEGMRFVGESPAKEIALTHVEVDSQIIADAAQRAQVIFSDAHLAKWPADDDDRHPRSRSFGKRPWRG